MLPYVVANNATFNQAPLTGTKVQKDFDIINLTASNQDIIVRKYELVLNVLSINDKALASYCFGVNCHGAEVFADTVSFLPNQSVALEIDFIEASAPGQSLIRYQIINKNNLSDQLSVFMNYSGVLAIQKHELNNSAFLFYPNPTKGTLYLLNTTKQKDQGQMQVLIKDLTGKELFTRHINSDESEAIALPITELKGGLYIVALKAGEAIVFAQKLLIE